MKITRRQFVKMAAYAAAATGVSQFDILRLQKALAAAGDDTGSDLVRGSG